MEIIFLLFSFVLTAAEGEDDEGGGPTLREKLEP